MPAIDVVSSEVIIFFLYIYDPFQRSAPMKYTTEKMMSVPSVEDYIYSLPHPTMRKVTTERSYHVFVEVSKPP